MEIQIRRSVLRGKDGRILPSEAKTDLRMLSGSCAVCRADAAFPDGADAENAILLLPEQPRVRRYLAIESHSPYWCRPVWGTDTAKLPALVQELLIETDSGFTAYLPLCGDCFKTVICGTPEGFAFRMYAGAAVTECAGQPAFLCMEGDDPLSLLFDLAKEAARLLGIPTRAEKTVPPVFDRLGWCSWDAMQIRVNHAGIMEKAKEFREKGIPVGFAILDDMWADVPDLKSIPADCPFGEMVGRMHRSRLRQFEGDPARFPGGIRKTVRELHEAGIPHVGIWFPTTGYWAGLLPGSPIEQREAANLITLPDGRRIVSPEPEKAAAYFEDLCAECDAFGADFVKIDNQGFHRNYLGISPIGKSAKAIQDAIDGAVGRHFGGALINCMGMPSECMFHRRSAVSRCSDDFIPEDRQWFLKNVLQCSFNGLLQGQFYVNDWDMWWTDDAQARKNSVCRAISGGPVYVSDPIGRSKPEILRPLTLSDGTVLRPDESATPTADCLTKDPRAEDPQGAQRVFKIRNRVGENGLIAVFHLGNENTAASGSVSPSDARLAKGDYAYYEFFTKCAGILRAGETLPVRLASPDEFRLFTFAPLRDGVALLGRTDLMIGVKAVSVPAPGHAVLAEGGEIGFVSEKALSFRDGNGTPLPTVRRGLLSTVTATGTDVYYSREERV